MWYITIAGVVHYLCWCCTVLKLVYTVLELVWYSTKAGIGQYKCLCETVLKMVFYTNKAEVVMLEWHSTKADVVKY